MNDYHVLIKAQALPILRVGREENLLGLARQVVLTSVQRVVKGFGDLKEIIATGDYVPVGCDLQLG